MARKKKSDGQMALPVAKPDAFTPRPLYTPPLHPREVNLTVREVREALANPDLHENDLTNIGEVSVRGNIIRVWLK